MPEEKPVLTLHLPCIKFSSPCPYADRAGKERDWTCCGVRPAVKMILLRACPQIDVARKAWVKGNKK